MKAKDIIIAYSLHISGVSNVYYVFAVLVFARFVEAKIREVWLNWKLRSINDKRG